MTTPPLLTTPIAAAHMSLVSNGHPTKDTDQAQGWKWIPDSWKQIRFDAIDALYLNPFIVEPDWNAYVKDNKLSLSPPSEPQYSFGIDHPEVTWGDKYKNSIEDRVHSVVQMARAKKKDIKIFAMQYYGSTALFNLVGKDDTDTANRVSIYAKSVPGILTKYDLDGYDIDYEWNDGGGAGNLLPFVPDLLAQIRTELDELTKNDPNHRPYYISISPASTKCLNKSILNSVSHVNIQTYDGGWSGGAKRSIDGAFQPYLDFGFKNNRLLFGIWPETTKATMKDTGDVVVSDDVKVARYSPGLQLALDTYDKYKGEELAGIHSWQINNDDQLVFENQAQVVVYNHLHPEKAVQNNPPTCDEKTLIANWQHLVSEGGGGAIWEE